MGLKEPKLGPGVSPERVPPHGSLQGAYLYGVTVDFGPGFGILFRYICRYFSAPIKTLFLIDLTILFDVFDIPKTLFLCLPLDLFFGPISGPPFGGPGCI